MRAAGISQANRAFVAELHRKLPGPFTPHEAAEATGSDHDRTARLLRHLAEQGWLVRLQRGLYSVVPLDAERPDDWTADPWAIAATALTPGYVGGWTALHHWGLTDQIFSTTLFVTAKDVPRRHRTIGGQRFELRHRSNDAIFGTRRVWRDRIPVEVSDRERTLVDCLDDPSLGGGLWHTTEALRAYSESAEVSWGRIVEYGDRLGNRTVFKRLGYLLETLALSTEAVIDDCQKRVSTGIGRLDPALPARGRAVSRWALQINSRVDS